MTTDPGPIIVADPGISHDEVCGVLHHGLDAIAVKASDEDVSTLAHHLRGVAAVMPRIFPEIGDPAVWLRGAIGSVFEAFAEGVADGTAAAEEGADS